MLQKACLKEINFNKMIITSYYETKITDLINKSFLKTTDIIYENPEDSSIYIISNN